MPTLDVYYRDALVGVLRGGVHQLEFEYAVQWLDLHDAFPISVALPLSLGPRPGDFFSNLLPEGPFREVITRRLRIAYDDDFALLEAIGGECAGALNVLPAGVRPDEPEARAEEMSLSDLERLASSGAYTADRGTARGPRLSLAGAQGKLPVVLDDGRFYLPLGNTPSTHLVKFQNPTFRHLPENEVLTTALLRELGVPCATTVLYAFGTGKRQQSACCVTRYDRVRSAEGTTRLHQEDLCQALGLSSHDKYEVERGPSFPRLYDCVQRTSSEPFVDTRALIDWWLLCWLCGNSDAHAKNLALLYHERPRDRALRLAPFYDLVCTRAYPGLDRRLATSIGGEFDPGQVGKSRLQAAAKELGVRGSFLVERAVELAHSIPDAIDRIVALARERNGPCAVYDLVSRVTKTQSRRALTLLATE
jgi:serine/threonine-protein kinase HipA